MERLLILNPGSTSTKIAVYDGNVPLFTESVSHCSDTLKQYPNVTDQYAMRLEVTLDCLEKNNVPLSTLSAIVSRGGLLPPLKSGAYAINEDMVWQLKYHPQHQHASNVGAIIAFELAKKLKIPAYVYDGVTMDEMLDINRISGLPSMEWKSMGHNLNTRAVALRYAKEIGKDYKDLTLIVAHLGGGITVNLHHDGRIEDNINDEGGSFSPERAGSLPLFDVIHACFKKDATDQGMMKLVKSGGGLLAHLGTTDSREVEKRIQDGDVHAQLVYDAMILNVAKNICRLAPEVFGKVDAILLTGGIANSEYVCDKMKRYVSFLAPVFVYPGENEMQALAEGGLRVLLGKEIAHEFVRES